MEQVQICEIHEDEYSTALHVITESFKTVAEEFNLTKENAPTNPAFFTLKNIDLMREKNIKMYGLYQDRTMVGFVACESAGSGKFYIERLSVLPEYRHKGYGKVLMDYVLCGLVEREGKIVEISLIDENTTLKNWYKHLGFVEIGKREFEHLPFTVCFMRKNIETFRQANKEER